MSVLIFNQIIIKMRKVILTLFFVAITNAVWSQQESVKSVDEVKKEVPKIEFKEKIFNFGTIVQGDTVEHIFVFENVGTAPLKINSATGSCGCTIPSYTKEAIAPGKKGEVLVRFNSIGKLGAQNKTVTLKTNTIETSSVVLTLRGTVETAKSDGK